MTLLIREGFSGTVGRLLPFGRLLEGLGGECTTGGSSSAMVTVIDRCCLRLVGV